ncbi:MAG TPA: endonuclease/exonuclease/phosphatase family protein [Oligoflexus sp.]|uniref:endonuclease/exonuclease/phosphatase family protein n=1 Tax=Oligoflexus sp. TaxID=1971216 RepID=UPI002D403365|nr:endonuclease/exonuclease/phosphatase family protein [Oligoflexus sp.]HYX31871.1 endonuclease/exonuclease/phosphatase family protein [Oligoflexus sp.]
MSSHDAEHPSPTKRWPSRIKIVSFNAQDLFLNPAYEVSFRDVEHLSEQQWQLLAPDEVRLKSLLQLRGIARMIHEEDPDILGLCEVGGHESLVRFNEWFLHNRYDVLLVPSQSHRGIENGFLVKKGLPLHVKLKTHMHWRVPFTYPHEDDPHKFAIAVQAATYMDLGKPAERRLSRDIPALMIRNDQKELILILLMVHLKSGFDMEGIDPGGQVRRAAEVKALIDIYASLQKKHGVPVMIVGDFNGNASRDGTASEFLPIYEQTDLEDALWLSGRPKHERLTHVTFFSRNLFAQQLDFIFLPTALHQQLNHELTYVYRYRFDDDQQEIMLPTTFHDRRQLPSDHYPIVCVLDSPTEAG